MSNRGDSPDLSCRPPRHLCIVGCSLKKLKFTKEMGGGRSRRPQDPPNYVLDRGLTLSGMKISVTLDMTGNGH